jgi:hypothetical protein
MLVAQELWYTSKGAYKHRKNLVVVYKVESNGATNIVHVTITSDGERIPDFGYSMGRLPDMEVTATRYRDFEKKAKNNTR